MSTLTHLDEAGAARMVDVSDKDVTDREAVAEATITLSAAAFEAVTGGTAQKGDVLAAARIAGIMAAKKTSELIPLCHPLAITSAGVEFETGDNAVRVIATVKTSGQTGVEMEALTAASIAALTIYDMVKAVDKGAVISGVRLLSKSGGKSGDFAADAPKVEKQAYRSAGTRGRARPAAIMNEVAMPRRDADQQRDANQQREAFRTFMTSRRLRATQWAKEAGVPAAHIFAFLTGKQRSLPSDVAERLARVAKARVEDMFR
jgi:cyclic pyranopterin phosphate synthase